MSRFDRLRDWPERLARLSLEELLAERRYWLTRAEHVGHRQARKELLDHARTVEKVIRDRFPDFEPRSD